MKEFSKIEYSFRDFIKDSEEIKLKARFKVNPFPESELNGEAQKKRIELALNDYWNFDRTYFPPESYDNYANPNLMLKRIAEAYKTKGWHLFLGPRKHGKTATGKKLLIFLLVTGKIKIAGVYSETLNKSSNILKDIYALTEFNDRLRHDFDIQFNEANSDQITFTVMPNAEIPHFDSSPRYCASFSEGRSVRGYTRLFFRPQFMLADDVETLESSFSPQAVELRINKLSETFHSLQDNSAMLILGNIVSHKSAMSRLLLQYEQGVIPKNFSVHLFKAWSANRPLWKERYPAKTLSELKRLLAPLDEADWQTNFMMNPTLPEGFFFQRKHYAEFEHLPKDAKGVLYCDPNLAKKSKGDTTAITALLYSPSKDRYYVSNAVCKSFSDANLLLNTVLTIKSENKSIYAIAFDGNVTQESVWTQFIRNWHNLNKAPFPVVEYKRYRVNDLAKNVQLVFSEGKILFSKNFAKSDEGENYLAQLFAFTGEKRTTLDDAPDSLICAFEFLHERNLGEKRIMKIKPFKDYYSL